MEQAAVLESPARNWASRNANWLFFAGTFVYTWTIYGFLHLAHIQNQTTLSRWLLVAAYGPSLTAVALARFLDPRPAARRRGLPFFAVFLLAIFGAGSIECLDHFSWRHKLDAGLLVADLVLVSLAAFVLAGVRFPSQGVRSLLSGLTQFRLGAGWYLLAIALWPGIVLAGNLLARATGMETPGSPAYPAVPVVPLAVESLFWYLLFGGPLNEEAGWRGFAQTRLQERFNPLGAAAIVGAISGLWHVPLHLMGFYPMGAAGAVIRVFSIPMCVVFAWLFNRTRRSLIPVLLLHSARNTTSLFISRNYVMSELLFLIFAAGAAIGDNMWRKAPPERRES